MNAARASELSRLDDEIAAFIREVEHFLPAVADGDTEEVTITLRLTLQPELCGSTTGMHADLSNSLKVLLSNIRQHIEAKAEQARQNAPARDGWNTYFTRGAK